MREPKASDGIFVSAAEFNRLTQAVRELQQLTVGPGLEMLQSASGRHIAAMAVPTFMWAQITGHAATGDRLTYSWAEVTFTGAGYTGWEVKTGGKTGTNTAYNMAEVPTETYRFRPVPDDTVVQLYKLIGTAETYWFNGDENADTNVAVTAPDTLKVLTDTANPWDITSDKGKGVQFCVFRYTYGEPTNTLYQYARTLKFDDGGRLIYASAEVETVCFTGVESCW